jgi:hypothetical protein
MNGAGLVGASIPLSSWSLINASVEADPITAFIGVVV